MQQLLKKFIVFIIFASVLAGMGYVAYSKWVGYVSLRKAKMNFYSKKYGEVIKNIDNLKIPKSVKNKKDLEIVYMAMISKWKTGDNKGALKESLKIISSPIGAEHKDEAYFISANVLWNEGKREEALKNFKYIVENYDESRYKGDALYFLARYYEENGDEGKARNYYQEIVDKYPNIEKIEDAINRLGDLNIKLLYSGRDSEFLQTYTVKPGDTLERIAKKYNTTVELIRRINKIKGNRIRPYDRLKVVKVKFSIAIDKSLNILILKANGKFFKRYYVGTGKHGSTPVGNFKIMEKIKHPTWYKPDGGVVPFGSKENLLGTRWMSINYPGYGIHGTWDDDSVGKQSSMGCVRLRNKDVEELFDLVPVGTEVTIVD